MRKRSNRQSSNQTVGTTEGLEQIPEAPVCALEIASPKKVKRELKKAKKAKEKNPTGFSQRLEFTLVRPLVDDGYGVGFVFGLQHSDFEEAEALFEPLLKETGLKRQELEMSFKKAQNGGKGSFITLGAYLTVS